MVALHSSFAMHGYMHGVVIDSAFETSPLSVSAVLEKVVKRFTFQKCRELGKNVI